MPKTGSIKRALRLAWALWLLLAAGSWASPVQETPDDLRRELDAMRAEYEARIDALERRVRELEATSEGMEELASSPVDDVEALRAAALAAAGEGGAGELGGDEATAGATDASRSVANDRSLNRLNPEISFSGDVVAVSGGGRDDFEAREFELDLQAALDPFSRTRWTIAFSPEEGVEIEEGWILYSGLPGGLELKAGKFRQRFGPLNQQHLHALPQLDYPLAYATYFDEEGLAQTGIALSWLLPRPWASANEVILEVTDGENPAFGGESFERLVVLARLKNYWDLSAAAYLEWGLSGASGRAEGGLESEVLGSDLTFHWQPPGRAKYREFTWRSEVLRSKREVSLGPSGSTASLEAWGGYSYVESLLRRNLYAGVRYDWVESPLAPVDETTGWFPYLTWWQSEFVRLRAQYGLTQAPDGSEDDEFTLQLTWAAGPHKHENY